MNTTMKRIVAVVRLGCCVLLVAISFISFLDWYSEVQIASHRLVITDVEQHQRLMIRLEYSSSYGGGDSAIILRRKWLPPAIPR